MAAHIYGYNTQAKTVKNVIEAQRSLGVTTKKKKMLIL